MTPKVDESRCIGCGLCVQLCPELFSVDSRQIAYVSGTVNLEEEQARLEAAMDYCPVKAIYI